MKLLSFPALDAPVVVTRRHVLEGHIRHGAVGQSADVADHEGTLREQVPHSNGCPSLATFPPMGMGMCIYI